MKIFGLTGGTGCGKSTVAKLLEEVHKVAAIEGDEVVKEVLKHDVDPSIIENILGAEVTTDGKFDRAKFLPALFADREKKNQLERALGSIIWERLRSEAEALSGNIVVIELATIYENEIADKFDAVIVTECSLPTRISRLVAHRGLTETEAVDRINSQNHNEEKAAQADIIIDTDCTLEELPARVEALYKTLTEFAE